MTENLPGEDNTSDSPVENEGNESSSKEASSAEFKYKEYIFGEEAMRISPTEPYSLRRPIRRGHLNISQHYPLQQVLEDLNAIWDWILTEKLQIPCNQRHMYSAVLVVPETFDNRGRSCSCFWKWAINSLCYKSGCTSDICYLR